MQLFRQVFSAIRFHIPVLLVSIALTLLFTYPAIFKLDTHYIGDGGDNYQYAGFQYLVVNNLLAGKWPYDFIQSWRYPVGFEFERGYDSILSTLGGGLLLKSTLRSAFAYNVSILFSFLFNFWGSYLLFQKISKSRAWGVVAATAYGFSFYALARMGGHANLLLIGGFPLLVYSAWRWWQHASWGNMALMALSCLVIIFSSLQYSALVMIGVLVVLPLFALFYPRMLGEIVKKGKKHWEQFLIAGIVLLVVISPFINPFFNAYMNDDFIGRGSGEDFSPAASDLLLPNAYLQVPLSKLNPSTPSIFPIEQAVAIGPVVFLLFLFLALRFGHKKQTWFAVGLSAVLLLLMAGSKNPETGLVLPYNFLRHIPPFSVIPESGRLVILAMLVMLMAISVTASKVWQTKKARLVSAGVVLTLLLLERFSWGNIYLQPIPDLAFAQAVQQQPGAAVLDIPLMEQRQSILPIYYHKAVLTGEPHWLANTPDSVAFLQSNPILAGLACYSHLHLTGAKPEQNLSISEEQKQAFFEYLKEYQINTIVVHRDNRLYWEDCQDVLTRQTQLVPQFVTAEVNANGGDSEAHLRWGGDSFEGGLFFPRSGTVTLRGMRYAPSGDGPAAVQLDEQDLDTAAWQYQYSLREDGQQQALADLNAAGVQLPVQAGSRLRLTLPGTKSQGFMTIWYAYQADEKSETVELREGNVVRVYEDEKVEVYRVE